MAKDVRGGELRRQEKVGDPQFADEYDFRRKKFPIRTGIAAVSLFTLGSVLIWASTRFGLDGEHRGLSFLILGLIAFIPGSYATCQLYGSWKGWKGYDYSQIPSYDD